MKTIVKQVYNIYDVLFAQIIQDINESSNSETVRVIMIAWMVSLMLMAYSGILFMLYRIVFGPSIGMAF